MRAAKLVISKACALYGRVIKLATAVYHLLAAITAVGMFVKWAPGGLYLKTFYDSN
jgi:hypothetical protein